MVIVSETKQEIENGTAEGQSVGVHNGQGADSRSYIRETVDTSASNHSAQASPISLLSPPPPPYNPYPSPSNHLPLTNPTGATYRQSPLSRFLKAFILAFLLYILILGGAQRSMHMAFHSHGTLVGKVGEGDGKVDNQIGSANWDSYESNPTWPINFRRGDGYRYGARTTLTLPVDADSLYLFARGAYQHGNVRIVQSNTVERGTVHVEVRAAYHEEQAFSKVTLCRLMRGSNEHGIGIYTPVWGWTLNHKDQVQFQVTFTFPTSSADTLHIKRFEAETGLFSYAVGNLYKTIFFDQVSITTSNSSITVESITLEHGSFKSSNGPISGHYNISRLLKLATSNGQIKATTSLFNGNSPDTELEMRTCNGPIDSEVSLISQSDAGGTFRVSAHSSNSPITLRYFEAPPTSILTSTVVTSNGPASVKMHSTFEGSFKVVTSNAPSVLRASRGADGQRVIHKHKVAPNNIVGSVSGDNLRRLGGSTSVRSSNGAASLEL